ncbi:biotin--[acetyl-CoA-carboxylase] ligase [Pedobacter frigidisoli]|uniref:biotin--[acetyl-CoA-carboxylase] ligase n=1 Tax=Pedobacter frigidisoli TaxID=2530455 RepID=UPI0029316046|nr:biotin--[acetyl-CoA-carboxylase] ligase [Pedobacter frigidisoli]
MQNNTFSTLFVGQNLIKLKEIDSTNNFLKDLASNSEPLAEGTVIMADNQYAGRGQVENVWQTEPGKNISTSVYFRPFFLPLHRQFYLNIAVSLAVSEALMVFIPDGISIKWPNDIYHQNKKIGGILIENTLSGSSIKTSVIGIGLNINQEEFSASIRHKATSVIQILHRSVEIMDIMDKLFVYMEKYYLILKSGRYEFLMDLYMRQLYLFDKLAEYRQGEQFFSGSIKGVAERGQLLIEVDGILKSFNFKELEFTHTK